MSSQEVIAEVRRHPGFRALSAMIGERIASGRSLEAMWTLQELGESAAAAHEIIEHWPAEGDEGPLMEGCQSRKEEAAVRLWCFLGVMFDDEARNWPAILSRTMTAVAKRRALEDD